MEEMVCLYGSKMGNSEKIHTTVANLHFIREGQNFNSIVVGRDNRKLQKFFIILVF